MAKYFCEKCKKNHLCNSKIGIKHNGIKIVEKKSRNFDILLPDGTIWKRNSIEDFTCAFVKFDKEANKYYVSYYVNENEAKDRFKIISQFQKQNVWMEVDLEKCYIHFF